MNVGNVVQNVQNVDKEVLSVQAAGKHSCECVQVFHAFSVIYCIFLCSIAPTEP